MNRCARSQSLERSQCTKFDTLLRHQEEINFEFFSFLSKWNLLKLKWISIVSIVVGIDHQARISVSNWISFQFGAECGRQQWLYAWAVLVTIIIEDNVYINAHDLCVSFRCTVIAEWTNTNCSFFFLPAFNPPGLEESTSSDDPLFSEPVAPTLSLGERVAWVKSSGPEFGIVKWIGRMPQITSDWTVGVEFVSDAMVLPFRLCSMLACTRTMPLARATERWRGDGTLLPKKTLPNFYLYPIWPKWTTMLAVLDQVGSLFVCLFVCLGSHVCLHGRCSFRTLDLSYELDSCVHANNPFQWSRQYWIISARNLVLLGQNLHNKTASLFVSIGKQNFE